MTLQDDYLPLDSFLLKELQNFDTWLELSDSTTVYNEGLEGGYKWWDGKTEPIDIWQMIIEKVWGHLDVNTITGFEYWANVLSKNNELSWHQDKDEKEYDISGKTICPSVSTVYYGYDHQVEGGFIEIGLPNSTDKKQTERIQPKFNRIVTFDPSRWHRVMPIKSGVRLAFQINIWEDRPSFLE